jgi:predicted transcriptional regulator
MAHKELADAIIKKRGKRTRVSVAQELGMTPNTLRRLEGNRHVTSGNSQLLARNWVNQK